MGVPVPPINYGRESYSHKRKRLALPFMEVPVPPVIYGRYWYSHERKKESSDEDQNINTSMAKAWKDAKAKGKDQSRTWKRNLSSGRGTSAPR